MYGRRFLRWTALVLALAAFCGTAAYLAWTEENSCMGVRFLRREQLELPYEYVDLSRELEVDGEPAAVDVNTSTIYISQDIVSGTQANALPGTLSVANHAYDLRFLEDDRFSDLAGAVEDGYAFTLLAVSGNDSYMEYRVVFTTLPVMRLDGWYSHKNQNERDVMLGDVCLWAPYDPAVGRHSVKASATEWHLRGGTTASWEKKPWKLALEKKGHANNNVDFLGMGADDDWILNAMFVDDTKMKERLFMQLWNDWAEQAPWNHRMSTGQYVELVLNQSYEGVYCLQKRIDKKYLQMQEADVLLKGGASFFPERVEEAYEIVDGILPAEEVYEQMNGFYTGEDTSSLDIDNFLDVNLFLQYAAAVDNASYKNMFYLLEKEAEDYRLSLLPWDTDMSWGMIWINYDNTGGYFYDYEKGMEKDATRQEYESVRNQNPELDFLMAKRWQQLRQSVLTEEHILSSVDEMSAQLRSSGVMRRDGERWGTFFDGADNEQSLRKFLIERLHRMDDHFEEILQ